MCRLLLLFIFSLMLVAPQSASAQRRHRAPPAKGKYKKKKHKKHKKGPRKHRAPPAPEPDMPVRNPVELGGFSPSEGPPRTEVAIRGVNFDDTVLVRFNGRRIRITSREPTELKVRIPRRAVTDHFVVSKAGFPDQTTDKQFLVIRTPMIRGFNPRQGGAGTRVRIRGRHFMPGDKFLLGDIELPVVKRRHNRVVVRIPESGATARFAVQRGGAVVARSRRPFDIMAPPPVVDSFSPERGARGTLVRITGRNFEPTDRVTLAGRMVPIRGRGPTYIEVLIRNHVTGNFVIIGRHGRRAMSAETFVVIRPPRIARFQPRFGPPGTRITLYGVGFLNGDQVSVGGAMLTIRTVAHNRIVAELPAGVRSGPIYVQRGSRRYSARGSFEVIHPPVITDLKPRSAPPGSTLVVHGRNFMPGASVLLAGRRIPIVGRRFPEEIVARIPHDARTGEVVVVTRGGSARSPVPFEITHYAALSSFFPLHGLPGKMVILRGQHFHPGLRAFLGNRELSVISRQPTTLKVEIPKGAQSGRIILLSYGRRIVSRLRFTVDKPRPDVEFTFAPPAGRRGSEVTLTLTPPRQDVMVYFDGRPLPKKVLARGRRIVITIPSDARTGYFELELKGRRYRANQVFRVR
jgi:hypothetical protein